MDPRSSVVFVCSEQTAGNIEHAKNLLGFKIHELAGGNAGLYGLGNEGVYEVETGVSISNADLQCASVGKTSATGVSSTIIRTNSPIKPTGADADPGSLYSWGVGDMGEMGLGPASTIVQAPQKVKYDKSVAFVQVSSGASHSLATDQRGNLYAWGQNFSRQLGLYTKKLEDMQELRPISTVEELLFSPRLVPFSLKRPIQKVACGGEFTVVLTKAGQLWSWGAGECGQLGTGRCTFRDLPAKCELTPLPLDSGGTGKGKKKPPKDIPARTEVLAMDVACGSAHVVVLSRKGAVYAWGLNKNGQLGLGDTNTRFSAQEVAVNTASFDGENPATVAVPLQRVYAYLNTTAAIDPQGALWTWGSAANSRLMRDPAPALNPLHTRSSSVDDIGSKMGLQALGNTIRATTANGSKAVKAIVDKAPTTYSAEAGQVSYFGSQKIASFAFAAKGSAALVLSTLESISPSSGPLKGFSKLSIFGYGFWTSDKIIVKFSLVGGDSPSRSCTARLSSPGKLQCRPPKLNETGIYEVTVSFDGGKTYLPQKLSLRAFKETHAERISPKMVDLRQSATGVVTVTARSLHIYEEGTCDEEGIQMWPTEENIKEHLVVKLLVSCSAPGALEPVLTEVTYPGRLVPLQSLNYDSIVNPDGSVSMQGSIADEGEASLAEGSSVDGTSSMHSMYAAPDRNIECDVDFTKLGPEGSLIMIRGAFALNAQDFGSASPEFAPIICHSFCPSGSTPAACPAEERFEDDGSACSRHINILGSSFIPTSKLPTGMSIEALIRVVTSGAGGAKGKKSTVEKVVPIECDAADVISLQMPTLAALMQPGSQVPSRTPNNGMDMDPSSRPSTAPAPAGSPEECTAQIYFRLVVPPPTVVEKKGGQGGAKTPGTSPSKAATAKKEAAPMLSPEPVQIFLYKSVPIVTVPDYTITRRAGGAQLELRGTGPVGGFNFKSSDARVVLYRKDLGLRVEVPKEATYMLKLDEDVPVPEPAPEPVENDEDEEEEEEAPAEEPAAAAPVADLAASMSMLSVDASSLGAGESSAHLGMNAPGDSASGSVDDVGEASVAAGASVATNITIKLLPSTVSGVGDAHKIVFICPPLFMPALLEKQTVDLGDSAEEQVDTEATNEEGEGEAAAAGEEEGGAAAGTGAEEEAEDQYEPAMALDYLQVQVLLDGRSSVEEEESAHISLFYAVECSDEPVEVAGGAATPGAPCTIQVYSGCIPSQDCVVRLRGDGGEPIVCPAAVETEEIASPETVARMFAQAAAAEEAERLALERGPEPEKTEEELEEEAAAAQELLDAGIEPAEEEPEPEPEREAPGFADTGGNSGTIVFDLPDCADMEPIMDGNRKLLYVDVSLDGGATWDEAAEPLLCIK